MRFCTAFAALTGHPPFPWQERLHEDWFLKGKFPASCNLPTGLGKTSIIAIWLLALVASKKRLPRRLVYVVNRRTVVDQTTDEVVKIQKNLREAGLWEPLNKLCAIPLDPDQPPLAISTLRGQYADNQEWSADPARPAVISGTVDMIGSRLLFEGYRIGFKSRPLHAGFLSQDALLVHDEAHLEPSFQKLIERIQKEQHEFEKSVELPWPKLRVMALSATNRQERRDDEIHDQAPFELTDEEKQLPDVVPDKPTEPIHYVWKRLSATKTLHLHPCDDEKKQLAREIANLALKFKETGDAVLIFVRKVDDVANVIEHLTSKKNGNISEKRIETLTGTMRGHERDRMADPRREDASRVFARFLPPPKPDADESEKWKIKPMEGTVYLVCTSAGEVGVNISADHMVSDLSTFESMAQRLGRVNRFGNRPNTEVHVVYPEGFGGKGTHEEYERRRERTLALLKLLDGDASPANLARLDAERRSEAFAPDPKMLEATDILFDAWAMTTIKGKMPGRPPVAPYLHGIAEWEPPRTSVAWRAEVDLIKTELIDRNGPEFLRTLIEDYPLKPHELLNDLSDRVYFALQDMQKRLKKLKKATKIWIVNQQEEVNPRNLEQWLGGDKKRAIREISGCTLLLSPPAGGLTPQGTLDGKVSHHDAHPVGYDIADLWMDDENQPRRRRILSDDAGPTKKHQKMALIRTIDTDPEADEFAVPTEEEEPLKNLESTADDNESTKGRFWHWYARPLAAEDATRASRIPVTWDDHTKDVMQGVEHLVKALELSEVFAQTLILAARWHDLGKKREDWQRWIGNPDPANWHAKSGRPGTRFYENSDGLKWLQGIRYDYRHEFGSLLDILRSDHEHRNQLDALSEDMQDLLLHVIAAHHGFARPHFPPEGMIDPGPTPLDSESIAFEVIRRYDRLQRRYGRWGLAYLESLIRAADWAASASANATVQGANP